MLNLMATVVIHANVVKNSKKELELVRICKIGAQELDGHEKSGLFTWIHNRNNLKCNVV